MLSDWLKIKVILLINALFFLILPLPGPHLIKQEWLDHFTPLPFFVKAIHLYQSLGNLQYQSLWESPLLSPFEELEHTADIAFLIRGMHDPRNYIGMRKWRWHSSFLPLSIFSASQLQIPWMKSSFP